MRLAKYLAHAGVASRRAAEAIVAEGRVTVGGKVVTDPARDVDEGSAIVVDGTPVSGPEPRVVYAVNKPLGVLSTARDPYERPTVVALLPSERRRLYPVGRLDADSTGLILLTNDGALAHRLTHPSFEVPKTYRVTVAGAPVGEEALQRLREGVQLEDGPTAPAHVRRLRLGLGVEREVHRPEPRVESPQSAGEREELLEITIGEGRNRQVRRMCEAVGHPVLELERVAFGSLRLGDLTPGSHRVVDEQELRGLAESPAHARAPTRPARRNKRRAR